MAIPERDLGMVFLTNSDEGMLLLRPVIAGTIGGRDHPALDLMQYETVDSPKRLALRELGRLAVERGPAAAEARFAELRDEHPEGFFEEARLNRLGYQLLGSGQADAAVTIFRLNVDAFPDSFNTYDSLGEGYMARGDIALAIENYERSLELNPQNDNARAMLDELR